MDPTMLSIIGILVLLIFHQLSLVSSQSSQIPQDRSQINQWYSSNVRPYTTRRATLDPALVKAEVARKVITVRKDGTGNFKTITDAIKSIPSGNTGRAIVYIGGGVYREKVKIDRTQPFVTLYGHPNDMPTLTFAGTSKQYGTFDSATLIVESDYFTAANVIFENSSPNPSGKMDAQAVAMRISGDKASFYRCKFLGYQDTLCDDKGSHFFKDCFIQGTVDFIFGSGTSLYLNNALFVQNGFGFTTITAPASDAKNNGFSFVHSTISGNSNGTYLGRAWKAKPRVVYAYTRMGSVVNPAGWSNSYDPKLDKSVFYGEYKCTGPGSSLVKRKKYARQLTDEEVKPFININFVKGTTWLLPPPNL